MTLKRQKHKMPTFVSSALEHADLQDEYDARPPYQRNDYIGWVTRAKREGTKQKRLVQMLDELKHGDMYMKMKWRA